MFLRRGGALLCRFTFTPAENFRRNTTSKFLKSYFSTNAKPELDWKNLGFDYVDTNSIVKYDFSDGKWDQGTLTEPYLKMHAMSNVLHYGQAVFEGLKAFHTKDGKVHVFNSNENAARLQRGLHRLGMPTISTEMFNEALDKVIEDNIDYVPPYGSGGSLYLRPFVFGHGAKLGLGKAPIYTFAVLACPVGSYYKTGIKAVDALVIEQFNRAAPKGVGNIKCAGNYAADVMPATEAAASGYPIALYLDAKEEKYIEEFSTSNFVAISKDKKKFITPSSPSILPSITNIMLQKIAADKFGMVVEKRPVAFEEISDFSEIAACGTAVIITPIKSITKNHVKTNVGENFDRFKELYDYVRGLQTGDIKDDYGWCRVVADKPLN